MPDSPPSPQTPPPRPLSRVSIGVNVTLQVVLGLVLFGLVNYLGYRHFVRVDLSPARDYTLSEATVNYIRKLSKDVELTVVFTRDSPIMADVRALVEGYRGEKKSRVRTDEVDPARDIEQAEQLKVRHGVSLKGNGILVRTNNRSRFISEEEIVIRGLNRDRDNPSVDFRGEDAVTSAIIGLIEETPRRFYFIAGKGATREDAAGKAFDVLETLGKRQNFEVHPLNLGDVDKIPDDAAGLVLSGPRYDLSEPELALLSAYWEQKQASLFILLDPAAETPRLHRFLIGNGVTPRRDRVLYAESTSTGPKKQFSVQTWFLPDSLISRPFTEAAASFSGQTQSLALDSGGSAALKARHILVTPLIDAADRFWGEVNFEAELPVVDAEDTRPPVHLAASVERGAVSDERLRVDSARMVVVGNATMLDPDTRLGVHEDFTAACLNWMLNRERLIGAAAKRRQMFRIEITEEQRREIFWVTGFLMPGAALALGFILWSHRRA